MTVSRRHFLRALVLIPGVISIDRPASPSRRPSDEVAPKITNHNGGGLAKITEGRTLLVSVELPFEADVVGGSFPVEIEPSDGLRLIERQQLYFYAAGDRRTFRTILSAPLDAVEGAYELNLSAAGGIESFEPTPYVIERGTYRRSVLTLSRNFSSPSPALRKRLRREFETMVSVYGARTPRLWRRKFIRPVSASDPNNFGVRRIVNNTKRYRHAGLDYSAPLGTPVRAVNDGMVVLSTRHWTPGLLVCIDHGGGVFSRYIHLSEARVKRGDRVRRGQLIGLSGRSGGQRPRPHLHMDVVVNGTPVDPKQFMRTAAQLVDLEASTAREFRRRKLTALETR